MPNKYRAIQVLPVALANQIAAGEVIERPASCIKELLENSLDAGATEIHLDIDAGGMRQIVITDNGSGIEKEDLKLSISAHATSKIQVQQDLFKLTTLGFRGEALASIQAVSKVEIISKRPSSEKKAYKLISDQDDSKIVETYFAGEKGTTVIVKDLFYNVPARKKFLKSEKTEYLHIENLVTALALSHPEVAIYFNHNQKQVYYLPRALNASQLQGRVAKLLGKSFLNHAIELNVERVGLTLTGFVGLPEIFPRTNRLQYFYINGRLIKDKLITHAIKSFFQEKQLLGQGLYPAYVLYFSINPEEVDVNVHPTKHEVRFHEPRLIHDFIISSLNAVVSQTGLIEKEKEEQVGEFKKNKTSGFDIQTQVKSQNQSQVQDTKLASVFLKQATEPSCSSSQDRPNALGPIIKIGSYLLLSESLEKPGEGRVIDIHKGQADLLSCFLGDQQNDWFSSKPLLAPLIFSTPYIEQWLWPEKKNFFMTQCGFIYQFKQKKELLLTHLPQILSHMTHKERIDILSILFQSALHNGLEEWKEAIIKLFPPLFLGRLTLENWIPQVSLLKVINYPAFIMSINENLIKQCIMSY